MDRERLPPKPLTGIPRPASAAWLPEQWKAPSWLDTAPPAAKPLPLQLTTTHPARLERAHVAPTAYRRHLRPFAAE